MGAVSLNTKTFFDPQWYLERNPDVAAAGVEPFTHYTKTGWKEGRFPNPSFDPKWYLKDKIGRASCRERACMRV